MPHPVCMWELTTSFFFLSYGSGADRQRRFILFVKIIHLVLWSQYIYIFLKVGSCDSHLGICPRYRAEDQRRSIRGNRDNIIGQTVFFLSTQTILYFTYMEIFNFYEFCTSHVLQNCIFALHQSRKIIARANNFLVDSNFQSLSLIFSNVHLFAV